MAMAGSQATRLNLLTSAEEVVAKRTSSTHEFAELETTCHSKMGEGEKESEAKSAKMGRRMGAITTQKSWPHVLNFRLRRDMLTLHRAQNESDGVVGECDAKKNPAPTFRSGTNLTKLSLDA